MKKTKLTYSQTGDNYETKDPTKKLAQESAKETAIHLQRHGFSEVFASRGESAYVWKQKGTYMATVIEGLGTKNLIADEMRKITGKTYYDVAAHDTVATIINDLTSVGATPLTVHAYWAIENNDWLQDKKRMSDLISGWKKACDIAGASWGGGETPTLKGIIKPETAELGGSAVGIISSKKRLITDERLKEGDQIILLKSAGVNANGISLTRAIAKKLKLGYATKLPDGKMYGEALLTKTHIYAPVLEKLFNAGVTIHYISNITGHGLRKLMRGRPPFRYVIEKMIPSYPIFDFIQKEAHLSEGDMYETYNMGMDYALFVKEGDVKKTLNIIKKAGHEAIHAGYIEKGEKEVLLTQKNIVYKGDTLNLR